MTETQERNIRILVWVLLALPALAIVWPLAMEGAEWRAAIRPSGDVSAKLIVLALAISPLRTLFPSSPWVLWMARRRRWIGVSAFLYAALHVAVFSASIGRLDWIVQGMAYASMWTGWAGFAILAFVASISNDRAMRVLRRSWKRLQRLVHLAAVLVLAHWVLLTPTPLAALAHFGPLALLQVARLWTTLRPA